MAEFKSVASSGLELRPQGMWKTRDEGHGQNRLPAIDIEKKDAGIGVENNLPLSPQWLLAKDNGRGVPADTAGKEKWREVGRGTGDSSKDRWKSNRNDRDGVDGVARRTPFDRWGEDERDIGMKANQKPGTKWVRDGEKEMDVGKRIDRWSDLKGSEDASRPRGDRWGDAGRDTPGRGFEVKKDVEERKDSRWTTSRWGASDERGRDFAAGRSKWNEPGKDKIAESIRQGVDSEAGYDADVNLEKPAAWRPHGRGRGEVPPTFGYRPYGGYTVGRGKLESPSPVPYSVGRGRGTGPHNPSASAIGGLADKKERWDTRGALEKADDSLQYSKEELLELYEQLKESSELSQIPPDFLEVPQLTHELFIEPVASIEPTAEEQDILAAIQRGDITSSGIIHPLVKNRDEDLSAPDVQQALHGRGGTVEKFHPGDDHHSPVKEHEGKGDMIRENSRVPWRRKQDTEKRTVSALPEYEAAAKDAPPKASNRTPEECEKLSLEYKDPQGEVQGPFLGALLISWHEQSFFGLDLPVRISGSSADTPFEPLGIMMPHLLKKNVVPPGFNPPKGDGASEEQKQEALGAQNGDENKMDRSELAPVSSNASLAATNENTSFHRGMPPSSVAPEQHSFMNQSQFQSSQAAILEPARALNPPVFPPRESAEQREHLDPQNQGILNPLLPEPSQKLADPHQGPQSTFPGIQGNPFDNRFTHPGFAPGIVGPLIQQPPMEAGVQPQGQTPILFPPQLGLGHMGQVHPAQVVEFLLQSGFPPDMPLEQVLRIRQVQQQEAHLQQIQRNQQLQNQQAILHGQGSIHPTQQSLLLMQQQGQQGLGPNQPQRRPELAFVFEQQQQQQQQQQASLFMTAQQQANHLMAAQQQGLEPAPAGGEQGLLGPWMASPFGGFLQKKEGPIAVPGMPTKPEFRGNAQPAEELSLHMMSHLNVNGAGQGSEDRIPGGGNNSAVGVQTETRHEEWKQETGIADASQLNGESSLLGRRQTFLPDNGVHMQRAVNEAGTGGGLLTHHWHPPAPQASKSLMEIQEEERRQRMIAEEEERRQAAAAMAAQNVTSPWKAPAMPAKSLKQILEEEARAQSRPKEAESAQNRSYAGTAAGLEVKPSLRDVMAEELLSKAHEAAEEREEQFEVQIESSAIVQEAVDETEFTDVKEAKKNKKKANKSKPANVSPAAAARPPPVTPPKVEKPSEPALPQPPASTLSDFLPSGPEPKPAWSSRASAVVGKKGLTLKEIQETERREKEEQLRQQLVMDRQLLHSQKASAAAAVAGPWARFTGKPAAPLNQRPTAGILKPEPVPEAKGEMFWDYPGDTPPPVSQRPEHPPASQASPMPANRARAGPTNASSYAANTRQPAAPSAPQLSVFPALGGAKKTAPKPAKQDMASSQQAAASSASSNANIAQNFRQWCEFNMKRITNSTDTTLLEFCMSLPTAKEAGDYLTEYLGSSVDVRAFKEDFLAQKSTMSPEVARLAFPVSEAVIKDKNEEFAAPRYTRRAAERPVPTRAEEERESEFKAGKKKGKKGKKAVDPALLGFSTTTNRIMVGEIDRVEES